jgi:quercetin dioxygenase-like cupin family protein
MAMQKELATARAVKKTALMAAMTAVILGGVVAITQASPASDVTPTRIARGTFQDFKLNTDPNSPIEFHAKAKSPVDFFVRQHDYNPGGQTGWHTHPGPVFITVTQGTLTYYLRNDPSCERHEVHTGEGFVDDGHGHLVRNETGEPAQDVSVILAPVAGAFRGELDAPDPDCGF